MGHHCEFAFTARARSRYLVLVIRSAAVFVLIGSWSLGARAQAPQSEIVTRPNETTLMKCAMAAFAREDYRAAEALFERVTVRVPSLTGRLFLARSRAALGHLVAAAADYRSVVAGSTPSDSSDGERVAVASAVDELAQLRPRIPSVEVNLGLAELRSRDLRLLIDGHPISSNAPVAVDPGSHEVVASDAEGEQARLSVEVVEGETKAVEMAWHLPTGRANKRGEAVVGGSSARHAWGVVALGVGATGLGVGTVTGIAALSRYSAASTLK